MRHGTVVIAVNRMAEGGGKRQRQRHQQRRRERAVPLAMLPSPSHISSSSPSCWSLTRHLDASLLRLSGGGYFLITFFCFLIFFRGAERAGLFCAAAPPSKRLTPLFIILLFLFLLLFLSRSESFATRQTSSPRTHTGIHTNTHVSPHILVFSMSNKAVKTTDHFLSGSPSLFFFVWMESNKDPFLFDVIKLLRPDPAVRLHFFSLLLLLLLFFPSMAAAVG